MKVKARRATASLATAFGHRTRRSDRLINIIHSPPFDRVCSPLDDCEYLRCVGMGISMDWRAVNSFMAVRGVGVVD